MRPACRASLQLFFLITWLVLSACKNESKEASLTPETAPLELPSISSVEINSILREVAETTWSYSSRLNTGKLHKVAVTSTSITIEWDKVSQVKEYLILTWDFAKSSWQLYAIASSNFYRDTVSPGTTHRYVVMPLNRTRLTYGFSQGVLELTALTSSTSGTTSGSTSTANSSSSVQISSILAGNTFTPWICYYGNDEVTEELKKAKLVVLDGETKANIATLNAQGVKTLGYLSLGEVDINQDYYKSLSDKSIVLEANPLWEGAYVVDVRSTVWHDFILNQRIPYLQNKGFKGLFFDTLDSVITAYQADPTKNAGMLEALVALIKKIKSQYPDLFTMANRGVEVADQYGAFVNSILAESLYTDYDFTNQVYTIRDAESTAEYVSILLNIKSQYGTAIYGLNYWYSDDTTTIQSIYAAERARGFIPYVSAINLNTIYPLY